MSLFLVLGLIRTRVIINNFRGKNFHLFLAMHIAMWPFWFIKSPDFPNVLEGILIMLCCIIGIKKGETQHIKNHNGKEKIKI